MVRSQRACLMDLKLGRARGCVNTPKAALSLASSKKVPHHLPTWSPPDSLPLPNPHPGTENDGQCEGFQLT
jgi:hypothetical protein